VHEEMCFKDVNKVSRNLYKQYTVSIQQKIVRVKVSSLVEEQSLTRRFRR
jgi:hypothetical protein